MKKSDYIKKIIGKDSKYTSENLEYDCACASRKKTVFAISFLVAIFLVSGITIGKEIRKISLSEENTIEIITSPSAVAVARTTISIPTGTVNVNPFLPYRDIDGKAKAGKDVPEYDLVEPPESVDSNSDAIRVMDTIVSGILYDKYSPSAILNIEGNDYLVKKHDTVNNYEILNITRDSVTVKLGANVYKAGIGEILTEGTINHNKVSNLNNKFGGAK